MPGVTIFEKKLNFYTHDYLLLRLYIFYMPPYMPPYKLFSTARSYLLGLIIFFTPQDIFYRYNFTHASPILFSPIKSTPTLIFLKFTFTQIQVVFLSFFLMQFHQIQHNFHRHAFVNNTRPSHYHIFCTTPFE